VTRTEQKERERRFVDSMVSLLPLDLAREPEQPDPPEPDVKLVLADGRTVRVEIVEAIESDVAATWKGVTTRVKRAIESALERDGVTATVALGFHLDALAEMGRRRRVLEATAESVATIVRESLPDGLEADKSSLRRHGVEHLRWIQVQPSSCAEVMFVSRVDPAGPQLIQGVIDGKLENLDGYRRFAADEHWLLVVGGEPLSGYVTIHDAQGAFVSDFDRTLFLDRVARSCVYLQTTPAEGAP
jgi:hypothetical protein